MKKLFILVAFQVCLLAAANAQVLNVNNNEQEQDQWCWAGCTKTILDYYGYPQQQCAIAEYVRTVCTWYNFGSVNCCIDPTQGCNYWNYNWGTAGSVQDILVHFGNVQNIGVSAPLTLAQITTEIQNNRLFVIRWGWSSGGGHFLVGHGINGNNIYFMNPWFGEGLHIADYNNVVNGVDGTSPDTHTWTHTNKVTSFVTAINELSTENTQAITAYPNPFSNETILRSGKGFKNATISIYNVLGQEVKHIENISGTSVTIPRDGLTGGIYHLRLNDGNTSATQKLVISDN